MDLSGSGKTSWVAANHLMSNVKYCILKEVRMHKNAF